MSAAEHKEAARRFFEEVADGRQLDLMDTLFVAEYVHHDPNLPPAMTTSREGYKGHLPFFYAAFPDTRMAIDCQVAEGDRVATQWTLRGTNEGEMMGMPPTGKAIAVSGVTIQRFENGKIVEGWTTFDMYGMLVQLGVIPAPGA